MKEKVSKANWTGRQLFQYYLASAWSGKEVEAQEVLHGHFDEKEKVMGSMAGEMPVTGRLEITIKIGELPEAETVNHGWQRFDLDCDGRIVRVTVEPKVWKKLQQAQEDYPMWVAVITGKMGNPIPKGFILDDPGIRVFEKKPRPPQEEDPELTAIAG